MPKVSPSRDDRGTECAMPSGRYVDALPSRDEGGYSPMTEVIISERCQEIHDFQSSQKRGPHDRQQA
jgi:hypothetical protein